MNNTKILKKAYNKALKGGYKCHWGDLEYALNEPNIIYFSLAKCFYGWHFDKLNKNQIKTNWFSSVDLIFDHSFAKAFWGERNHILNYGDNKGIPPTYSNLKEWEYHLQQMVRKEEPLKYLEKFLIKEV